LLVISLGASANSHLVFSYAWRFMRQAQFSNIAFWEKALRHIVQPCLKMPLRNAGNTYGNIICRTSSVFPAFTFTIYIPLLRPRDLSENS
jgi:hypothetical protein